VNRWLQMGALALVMGFGAIGCQNTAEGVREDAQQTGQAVEQTAERTGAAVQEGAQDAGAALALTPKVKNAITADPQLNEDENLIDVDSTDQVVHLKGHVTSNELKRKAGEIAERVIKESGASQKVSNELIVQSR
jgi:predicted small secreted protein